MNFAMEQNVGLTDRYIRITVGSLLVATGAARLTREPGLTGTALALLGGITLAEGVLGTCLFYSLADINTRTEPTESISDQERNESEELLTAVWPGEV